MSLEERYALSIQQIADELSRVARGNSNDTIAANEEPEEFPSSLSKLEGVFVDLIIL
jgi:hypothetical protein